MGIKVWARPLISSLAIVGALMVSGCGSGSPSMSNTSTATPTFSPGAGSYNSSQAVTISDSTSGAVLYCTTDGSTPTTSSPKCSQPTTVYQTEFLQAIAVAPTGSPSAIASAAYTINLSAAATPAFSPAGGSYATAQTVTITDATTGANIYYTTDGSTPSASSTLYTAPVTVTASETISAIAVASGYSNSGIASATYNITTPVATPAFSVPSGSYTSAQTVTITDATSGASIFYTTDGSTPSSGSTAYTAPISVTETQTISAIAILGDQSSAVSVAAYTIGQTAALAAPVFSLAAGTYTSAQSVSISVSTPDAAIYYTTDGSTPSGASTAYTVPIDVTKTETISAIAILAGDSSPVVTATYTISVPVAAPVFSVPSGNYTSPQSVSLTDATPNAAIYYTLDGSTPTASSTAYTAPISVALTETISAIAILGASSSPVVNAAYTINQTIAAPVFSVPSGNYASAQSVSLTEATPSAAIYYTLDGSTPTASSTPYTAPISVTKTETISAIAILGASSSPVVNAAYTINQTVAAPVFSVPSGNYASAQSVSLTDVTPNAAIYYTLDGSTPTASSTPYTALISVTKTEVINAVAILGATSSPVVSAAYTINDTVAPPVFSLASGTYTSAQMVSITDATANATIHYTTDGTMPTASSTAYTGPIAVGQTQTISAIAVVNTNSSTITSATYTINVPVAAPVFSIPTGNYTTAQSVTITDATPKAVIYYAVNNTGPTAGSTPYTGAISVTQTQTISAIAILDNASSPVSTVAYTIGTSVAPPTFTPPSGSPVAIGQTVNIANGDAKALIYYTTDGTTPTAGSTKYTAPITLTNAGPITFDAVAIDGPTSSSVAIASYTVKQPTAAPTIAPASGSAVSAGSTVTITDTDGAATIYYTLDGSTPSAASSKYTAPIALSTTGKVTVNSIAIDAGISSAITTATYMVSPASVAIPTLTPASGASLLVGATVTITDTDANATIYYTTDGTTPSAASTKYTAPFALTTAGAATIKSIAINGITSSAVATATYTVSPVTVGVPTFTPASGASLLVGATVTISDSDAAAKVYYTTDGSTPSAGSTRYTAPFALTTAGAATVKAIAIDGATSSAIATATYTVSPTSVATPTFTPASGASLSAGATVTIADTDASATIYYTIDGSAPSAASTKYTTPFALTTAGATTVKAIAIDGATSSAVATASYTVSPASVATPTFTPASGTSLTVGATVTVADTDASATIYYTADGSTPSAASMQYTAPVALTTAGAATIKAIAIDGATSSAVATATYTVAGTGPSISGSVFSGTKPIKAAEVQLYAAGIAAGDSGYGSNATAVGAPVATSASGAFTLDVTCPASPGDLVYLVATGGDSGSGANSSIALMTALGPCANAAGASVTINEATTVASAYALSQFMTTATNVGSSTTNYLGLQHAFATVGNLVNVTSGAPLTHTPAYPTNLSGDTPILNNSTVPQARINTLANMLNACTATNGSGCSTLFTAATPPAGSAPTDTLQAILDIAQSPGANPTTRFSSASSSGPFQPVLGAAPNDWTLALTFTGGGLGLSPVSIPNVTYPFAGTPVTGPLEIVNTSLAIDAQGNVWVTAYADNMPTFSEPVNSQATLLTEFSNLGAPLTAATTLSNDATPVVTFGGFDPDTTNTNALITSAVDSSGNLWAGNFQEGDLYQVSSALATLQGPINLGRTINNISIDSFGNLWSAASSQIYETSNTGNQILSSNGNGTVFPGLLYDNLSYLAFDSNGGLWGADFTNEDLYGIDVTSGDIDFDLFGTGSGYFDTTLAADGAGNIYGCGASGGQTLGVFKAGAQTSSHPIGSGRGCGNQLVLDGLGRLFAITNVNGQGTGMTVDEFTTAGAAISGTNGYTGTSSGEAPTLNPDPGYFFPVPGISAAIDASGNLWVLNNDTSGATASGNAVVEFIGLGAPVVTPTSAALQNGQLGLRP